MNDRRARITAAGRAVQHRFARHGFRPLSARGTRRRRKKSRQCLSTVPKFFSFFGRLGFEKPALFSQKGFIGPRLAFLENSPGPVRNFCLDLPLRLCGNPQYYAYSDHLMYIGKRKIKQAEHRPYSGAVLFLMYPASHAGFFISGCRKNRFCLVKIYRKKGDSESKTPRRTLFM